MSPKNSLEVKELKKGSIKLILKGSDEGLKNLIKSFKSGELAALFEQFNLELKDAKLINSDSCDICRKNQKLLALIIASDASEADIDILKTALLKTSDGQDYE